METDYSELTDGEKILGIYGGPEAIKGLRMLTEQETLQIRREKTLEYLSWPDDPRHERWKADLDEIDAQLASHG